MSSELTAEMHALSIAALQREAVRCEGDVEVAQSVYDAAERTLANRKAYLELVRRDIALLTAVGAE